MTPGPTIIRMCSTCGKHILQHTIGSGNTFGARFWTDGKRDAPMLPDQPRLIKCPHCSTLVWIDEQSQVGGIGRWGQKDETVDRFKGAMSAVTPTFRDYSALLSAGVEPGEKERYVRLRAWWAGNDARREGDHANPMTDAETVNLRAFSDLLNENEDNDRLMKAETLRELGMFEAAEALLATPFRGGLMQIVGVIRSLNQRRNASVTELRFE